MNISNDDSNKTCSFYGIDDIPIIKVLYNSKYGGFGISEKAVRRLRELGYKEAFDIILPEETKLQKTRGRFIHENYYVYSRTDPLLVRVIEELGEEANGKYSNIKIGFAPKGFWEIDEYDGLERLYTDAPEIKKIYVYKDENEPEPNVAQIKKSKKGAIPLEIFVRGQETKEIHSLKEKPDKELIREYMAYVHRGYSWELKPDIIAKKITK